MDAEVASLFRGTPSRIETGFGGSNYGDGGSSGSGGSFGGDDPVIGDRGGWLRWVGAREWRPHVIGGSTE